MDELQISGKRYISSRRAAKDNGYHTDYIGQLIRANKVKGQKVGRTWYVEASSFYAYLGQPEAHHASQPTEAGVVEAPHPEPVAVVPQSVTPAMPGYIPSAPVVAPTAHHMAPTPVAPTEPVITAPMQVEVVASHATPEPDTFFVPVHKIERKPEVTSGGLRYVASESSLPEITRTDRASRLVEEPTAEAPTLRASAMVTTAPRMNPVRTLKLIGAVAVGIFAVSALVSSGLIQTINIEGGNPASIGYALHW